MILMVALPKIIMIGYKTRLLINEYHLGINHFFSKCNQLTFFILILA